MTTATIPTAVSPWPASSPKLMTQATALVPGARAAVRGHRRVYMRLVLLWGAVMIAAAVAVPVLVPGARLNPLPLCLLMLLLRNRMQWGLLVATDESLVFVPMNQAFTQQAAAATYVPWSAVKERRGPLPGLRLGQLTVHRLGRRSGFWARCAQRASR